MRAAAAAAELEPLDRDDLDARLAQRGVGARVALVGDDDAGLERDDVVAVVPLLALGLERVAAGLDHAHLADAERLAHQLGQRALLLLDDEIVGGVTGPDRPGARAAHDLREQRDEVAVAHRDDRVEVHVAARLGQLTASTCVAEPARNSDAGDPQHRLRQSCARPCRS